MNDQAGALVRQGRLAVYPSSRGQEACQIACATVLADRDWLFPTYRDAAAICARGVDPVEVLTLLRGDWHCGYDPVEHRVAPQATPLATQLLHAVGVAHAATLRGEDTVVMALCGDGATSEGDFHEACNFAAVFAAPVVFFVQNNKYAISVPLARQSVAPSLAAKAVGYGMPGIRVDGNDLAASEPGSRRGRRAGAVGRRPVPDRGRHLPHRSPHQCRRRHPLPHRRRGRRMGRPRSAQPLADLPHRRRSSRRQSGAGVRRTAEEMAARIRAGVGAETSVNPDDLFAHVYTSLTPQLIEQRAALRNELALEEAS